RAALSFVWMPRATAMSPQLACQDDTRTTDEAVAALPKKRGGGPRTPEGRARSRWNSTKHSMGAKVLLPDDLAATIAERTEQFTRTFAPRSGYEQFLVREMAYHSAQLDRAALLSIADLDRVIFRSELCWDEDRRAEVEDLGAKLHRFPARIARELARS